MPLIRPRHVLSFSSEDVTQPAQNLLKSETYRKWRCASPGEKQASVILELEKATQIHSIDIGNNGSALVEVLVGRSSWSSDEQFQVLLVASSFMSPAESKSFTSTNRVRMFGVDKLSKPVATQKWDRVKLVCTQPFNKNERYGLSFINLHSPPDDMDDDSQATKEAMPHTSVTASKRLGRFTLKGDSDTEEKKISSGNLFFKKFQKKTSPPSMSTAAEVRAAASTVISSVDKRTIVASTAQNHRHPSTKDGQSGDRETHSVASDRQPVARDRADKIGGRSSPKPGERYSHRKTSESTKRKHEDSPKGKNDNKPAPPSKKKRDSPIRDESSVPFGEIMKGVVFVMSGFVNPERGNLREKALQMGAQYRQDWGKGCTHLICAFANTPKFNQVKGKGKIVTKKWITDCFKKSRCLPTRRYHLPGDSSSSDESSEGEDAKPARPPPKTGNDRNERNYKKAPASDANSKKDDTPEESDKTLVAKVSGPNEKKDAPGKLEEEDDIYGGSTDDESPQPEKSGKNETAPSPLSPKETSSSDHDTEDELRRIQKETGEGEDIYGGTTDDEQGKAESADEVISSSEDLPLLPDFFSHKHFMLYGEIDGKTRRLLIRYITAYNGTIEDYMNDNVDFVITNEDWDKNFDEALDENPSLAFVRPRWIIVCHEKGTFVPFQPYIIVPS